MTSVLYIQFFVNVPLTYSEASCPVSLFTRFYDSVILFIEPIVSLWAMSLILILVSTFQHMQQAKV